MSQCVLHNNTQYPNYTIPNSDKTKGTWNKIYEVKILRGSSRK